MDWGAFVEKVGFPIAVAGAVAWVLWRLFTMYLWPTITIQIQQSRADREQERLDRIAERDKFLAALDKLVEAHEESTIQTVKALDALTKAVNRRNRAEERAEK